MITKKKSWVRTVINHKWRCESNHLVGEDYDFCSLCINGSPKDRNSIWNDKTKKFEKKEKEEFSEVLKSPNRKEIKKLEEAFNVESLLKD